MSPDRARRFTGTLLLLAVAALGFAFAFEKIRCFDYWWHLRTGAWMAQTGSVPRADPFTYTVEGAPWVDIHWLFQVLLYAVYRLGEHAAVVWMKVAFMAALLVVLALGMRRDRPAVTAVALGLMLLNAGDRFMPRPELPSFVLLAGVLALLERDERRGDAWVFAVLPLQVLWVNVHGLFAVGIAVCGIYAASEILRPLLHPGEAIRPRRALRLSLLTLLAAGVSLLNPNGLDGALYPIQQLGMIGPPEDRGLFGSLIAELIPPLASEHKTEPVALALAGGMAGLALLAIALNWRRVSGAHPLLWVAFAYLALGARRNMALMAIVYAPIIVRNTGEFLDRHPLPERAMRAAELAVVAILCLLTADVARGSFFPRVGSQREFGLGVSQLLYPAAAVDWIRREQPPGPIFHHMGDGGYLLWQLYPDYRSMVDGRLEVFGAERFAKLQVGSPENFKALDDQYHFGVILIHHALVPSVPLIEWLRFNTNWRLVFVDESAAVWVRVRPGEIFRWMEVDLDSPNLFPDRHLEPGVVDRALRTGRAGWYKLVGRPERALREWEQALAIYPDMSNGDLIHATLLAKAGKSAAAEAILRRLLRESPDSPALLCQVGDLRLADGEVEAARELYERALGVDPRNVYAVLQRAQVAEVEGDVVHAQLLYSQVVALSPSYDAIAAQATARLRALGGAGP